MLTGMSWAGRCVGCRAIGASEPLTSGRVAAQCGEPIENTQRIVMMNMQCDQGGCRAGTGYPCTSSTCCRAACRSPWTTRRCSSPPASSSSGCRRRTPCCGTRSTRRCTTRGSWWRSWCSEPTEAQGGCTALHGSESDLEGSDGGIQARAIRREADGCVLVISGAWQNPVLRVAGGAYGTV